MKRKPKKIPFISASRRVRKRRTLRIRHLLRNPPHGADALFYTPESVDGEESVWGWFVGRQPNTCYSFAIHTHWIEAMIRAEAALKARQRSAGVPPDKVHVSDDDIEAEAPFHIIDLPAIGWRLKTHYKAGIGFWGWVDETRLSTATLNRVITAFWTRDGPRRSK